MKTPYPVGYGKPPKDSQFKKGKSGNPLGRAIKDYRKEIKKGGAKAPLNFQDALIAELKSKISVVDANGKKKAISKLEAFAKSIANLALQGDKAATRYVLDQLSKLPENAFAEEGDGIYLYRYTEAQIKALEFLANDLANYEIPKDDQDSSPSSS